MFDVNIARQDGLREGGRGAGRAGGTSSVWLSVMRARKAFNGMLNPTLHKQAQA